jgi:hypothetical protein
LAAPIDPDQLDGGTFFQTPGFLAASAIAGRDLRALWFTSGH